MNDPKDETELDDAALDDVSGGMQNVGPSRPQMPGGGPIRTPTKDPTSPAPPTKDPDTLGGGGGGSGGTGPVTFPNPPRPQ